MNYHYLYILFLYYFNHKRDYYECHDVLEELWFETQRDRFYQGLLQVAVGLYHYRWKNPKGSILLFEGATEKLAPYPDTMRGIHVKKIKEQSKEYLSKLYRLESEPFQFYDLTIEILDEELKRMVHELVIEMEQG